MSGGLHEAILVSALAIFNLLSQGFKTSCKPLLSIKESHTFLGSFVGETHTNHKQFLCI